MLARRSSHCMIRFWRSSRRVLSSSIWRSCSVAMLCAFCLDRACAEAFEAHFAFVESDGYGLVFDAAFKRPFFGFGYAYAAAFWTFDCWVFHFFISLFPCACIYYYLLLKVNVHCHVDSLMKAW